MVSDTRFFFTVLLTMVRKHSFFSHSLLMQRPLVFFKPPYDECSAFTRFFRGSWKIKTSNICKTILRKAKYGDDENRKCDFRGWFYKFVIKVGYFIRNNIKRSPEIAILVKKNEICDFRGSFGNFLEPFGNFLEPFGNLSDIFSFFQQNTTHHVPFHRIWQRDGENGKFLYFWNFFFNSRFGQK